MSLEAKDIRVGNIVFFPVNVNVLNPCAPTVVSSVKKDSHGSEYFLMGIDPVDHRGIKCSYNVKNVADIPLQEEWLCNLFDFEKVVKDGIVQYNHPQICFSPNGVSMRNEGYVLDLPNPGLTSIRQLQNLYHSCTNGKELVFKNFIAS